MIISCKCLNITIKTLKDNILRNIINDEKFQFFNQFSGDKTNKKILGNLTDDDDFQIKFELSELVEVKSVQENEVNKWNIIKCLNCNGVTHGVCYDRKLIVINGTFLTSYEEIKSIKESELFSPIFNISVNKNILSLNIFGNGRNDTIITKLTTLKERYEKSLINEMKSTEKRISEYRDKQTQLFNEYKYRGEQEYNLLISIISNAPDENTNNDIKNISPKTAHLDTPPTTPDSAPIENSPPFKQQKTISSSLSKNLINRTPSLNANSNKNNNKFNNNNNNYNNSKQYTLSDADSIFDFDGLDYDNSSTNTTLVEYDYNIKMDDNDNETDDDDDDQVNAIRQYTKQQTINLAKSLPISMPVIGNRNIDHDIDEDDKVTEDNVDIAASIKALAKSVHGDTVFGDLPRPRFSTQI